MTDENNELILSAMGILTHAGDARLHTKEAVSYTHLTLPTILLV